MAPVVPKWHASNPGETYGSLRLRGKGWPQPKGERGDQFVKVAITPPKDLSAQEREYYEKIRDIRTYNPRSHLQRVDL